MQIHQKAHDFKLLDQDGKPWRLSDFLGKYVLLYFYPKDNTPGCTKEACGIRDLYGQFQKEGIVVLGVSRDSAESHKRFAEKYSLPFLLLSDPKGEVVKAYEADRLASVKRISYLIGPDGAIIKFYPKVDTATHAGDVLEDLRKIDL